MSHTPGPWAVEWSEEEGNDGVTIESPDGPVAFRVLEVDARLIAAAPELLAALIEAKYELIELYESAYPDDESPNEATRVIDLVIAAIAKAEGRE
jgi:hypothetical protein